MENSSRSWFKESITVKLIIVGVLTLLLLIPGKMIQNLIREREETRSEVISEINSKWGDEQTITGPVITIPYKTWYKENKKLYSETDHLHFLPDQLEVTGTINPEIRYRGIYKVVVYNADLSIKGNFKNIDLEGLSVEEENILWDQALFTTGITDMRGISKAVELSINNSEVDVNPGIPVKDLFHSGISSEIGTEEGSEISFDLQLSINGSESINFLPLGKTTDIDITSDWDTPSFMGAFLPDSREIDENGFHANWNILHLNRNYPQKWSNNQYKIEDSSFGVGLLLPVDQYQKAERSVKYAIMFIGLTFLIFFFSEVLNRKRIHPIQYLLVGLALVVFYTLLIALSEHIGFSLSYLVSSTLTISIIVLYYHTVIRKFQNTAVMALIMIALYLFLFTTTQLQDYALLMGSIGLFVVISVIMYLSRNIDWYNPSNSKREKE
ncbi:MAG: cell envelope integrity protein CreD [Bacteroidota bacterium]